ncbi:MULTISPECIES: late competence development ComFB family protein [Tissierellales]|jgi:competence protein ComFB|uniref:Competence protein ComFB n=1 Tax=Acidilutibacter cellobiosedens TaxID=2507161 RepID=A0A410QCQ0_9FIRM|nr:MULTISPECIES: late competence development ComFB family protein [Tissierellales]MBE6082582.1 competence protein ComFB [Tissierellaceae bacterium]QAT61777.1 competence protein ComFB [Acidilutibacter cellobiosedens]SCL82292.1 Late competence development protein ComFB [Sporanaerobacter sp. PP17-6a]
MIKLHNLMEDEVEYIIDKLLKKRKDVCSCEKCRLDIEAISLNNLPPKYVVTKMGEIYERLDIMNFQFEADLVKEVEKAIQIVKDSPHHTDMER